MFFNTANIYGLANKACYSLVVPIVAGHDAWCAGAKNQDKNQYIQVDFLLKTRVTRVGVLRRLIKDHLVTEYTLQYSDDTITWTDYLENGHVKVGSPFHACMLDWVARSTLAC